MTSNATSTTLYVDDYDLDLQPLPESEGVTLAVLAVVLSLAAMASNGVLIYVVMRTEALHTSTNFFIASLSAGEFLTGLFVIPFAGASVATVEGFAFSRDLCRFVGFVGILGPSVSAFSLLVVSVDRYIAISRPLRYTHLASKLSTMVVLGAVWLIGFIIGLLPLAGWGSLAFSPTFRTCLMRSSSSGNMDLESHGSEVVVVLTLCVFLPVTLIALIVMKTIIHIRGHRRVFAFVPIPVAATSLPVGSAAAKANSSRANATRALLLVSVAFIAMRLPGAVAEALCQNSLKCVILLKLPSSSSLAALLRLFLWLSYLSCVVNPLIIMGMNNKFRITLKILFCRRRRCKLCGVTIVSGSVVYPQDKEPFTISSGLHAVLEASLLVNVMHGTGRQDANIRRQVIMTLQNRGAELNHHTISHLSSYGVREGGRGAVQLMTIRRAHSTPDLRVPGLPLSAAGAAAVAAMTAAMLAEDDRGKERRGGGGRGGGQKTEDSGSHKRGSSERRRRRTTEEEHSARADNTEECNAKSSDSERVEEERATLQAGERGRTVQLFLPEEDREGRSRRKGGGSLNRRTGESRVEGIKEEDIGEIGRVAPKGARVTSEQKHKIEEENS